MLQCCYRVCHVRSVVLSPCVYRHTELSDNAAIVDSNSSGAWLVRYTIGRVLRAQGPLDEVGDEMVDLALQVAFGEPSQSEGMGHWEIIPT